jgi:hypothetical protein
MYQGEPVAMFSFHPDCFFSLLLKESNLIIEFGIFFAIYKIIKK